jgi:hypothetical protein
MDWRRVNLRAALEKIFAGEAIPKNVKICLENLASIYSEVDDVSYLNWKSDGTGWTEKALDTIIPVNVGNFSFKVETSKRVRTITVKDGNAFIRFIFDFVPGSVGDRFASALNRSIKLGGMKTEEDGVAMAKAVVESLTTGSIKSPEEIMLGDKLLSLKEYCLNRVERAQLRAGLFGFLPTRKAIIYEVK